MGNRSNLYLRDGDDGLGVYSHWGGLAMADAAVAILENPAFRERLGDASYATRIAVQTAFAALGVSAREPTGCGLWTAARGLGDNEHRVVVIDVHSGACYVTDEWRDPPVGDRLTDPTVDEIRAAMSDDD